MNCDYELRRGDQLLARLVNCSIDQPWIDADFEPTAAFAAVAPLFAEELQLLNAEKMDEWETVYDRIEALGLTLHSLDGGEPIRKFLLHVDGDRAWFRH